MNIIANMFIFILILVIVQYRNITNLTLLFMVAMAFILIQMIKSKNSAETEEKKEGYMTDMNVNTRLTSPDLSIISESALESGKTDIPFLPSTEYIQGKNLGVDESSKRMFPANPQMCLTNTGRDAIDAVYGVPPPVRGTDPDDVLWIYNQIQGSVDDSMANVMSYTSKLNKQSQTNRSRMTKRTFGKYFVNELQEQENRHGWWDNDDLFEMFE